jgi:putative hydrolase of the HAD superfamily
VSPFDAVLFDLDDTLCRHDQSAETIYRGAFDWADVDPVGTPDDLWAALDGHPPPDEQTAYLADGFAAVARQHGVTVDAERLAEGFLRTVDYRQVSFVPGAEAAVEAARTRGAVGLVTNGPASRQRLKVDALGLSEAFDVIVYAGDLPRRKPHPDPFEAALHQVDVPADEALYVGDSVEYDVVGGHSAGMQVAWIAGAGGAWNDGEWPDVERPAYVFEEIGGVADLLDARNRT